MQYMMATSTCVCLQVAVYYGPTSNDWINLTWALRHKFGCRHHSFLASFDHTHTRKWEHKAKIMTILNVDSVRRYSHATPHCGSVLISAFSFNGVSESFSNPVCFDYFAWPSIQTSTLFLDVLLGAAEGSETVSKRKAFMVKLCVTCWCQVSVFLFCLDTVKPSPAPGINDSSHIEQCLPLTGDQSTGRTKSSVTGTITQV